MLLNSQIGGFALALESSLEERLANRVAEILGRTTFEESAMAPAGRRAGKPKGSKNVPAYDGPQEDPRGSASASGSRGRAMSNAPSAGRDSSVSRGIRSPVRGPNPNSREASRTRLVQTQQAQGPVVLSRNVDFGGNAYNLYSDVSNCFATKPFLHYVRLSRPLNRAFLHAPPFLCENAHHFSVYSLKPFLAGR